MKKSLFGFMALLLLVGISSRYVAGTYAKYTSTVNGSGSATVAKWSFATDNADTDFEISITPTAIEETLVDERIAPGTSGAFDIELSNENSEVGVEVTIAFTGTNNVPSNLVFKQSGTDVVMTGQNANTLTAYIAAGQTLTVPLTWEWPYETTGTLATEDGQDTTDGETGAEMTVTAVITGVQVDPADHSTVESLYGTISVN